MPFVRSMSVLTVEHIISHIGKDVRNDIFFHRREEEEKDSSFTIRNNIHHHGENYYTYEE